MSHFTAVQTKMKDLNCILLALKDLGYQYTENEQGVEVRGYRNQLDKARVAVKVSGKYDVGIKQTTTGFELVADWWGVETTRGVTEQEFVNQLQQRYAYHKVVKEVKKRGFTLETEEIKNDNTLQLTVRRWQ
jgi:hypothetical protein